MSSEILLQNGYVVKQPRTFSAISDLALAVIDVIILHRLLVSYLRDGVVYELRILCIHTFL